MSPRPHASKQAPVARRIAVRGLCALTLINLLNYLDRYLVPALVPHLKESGMQLSDLELGSLMTGFLVVYMVTAPLFGTLGDRGSRTRPIAFGVFLWSLATVGSGFARNFVQLLISRAAVGIGEAAYGTIAPALLADYFPRDQRGRVFAVFFMAIPVGAALGYVVGGFIDQHYGWRAAFFVAGAPGLALAAWMLRLPDPPRGSQEADPASASAAPAVAGAGASTSTVRTYWKLLHGAPYTLTVLGYAAYTFAVGGLAFWMPTFLERARGVPAAQATTGFGAIVIVTGVVGTFAGGWLGDYGLKYSRQAYLWVSAAATLLAVPFVLAALMVPQPALYYPAIVLAELLLFVSTGPINSAIVNLVAVDERASAVALSILMIHLLGDVASPPLIGAVSDRTSLGLAVLIVPIATALSALLWVAAARASRRHDRSSP